jgi:hypothetical protein
MPNTNPLAGAKLTSFEKKSNGADKNTTAPIVTPVSEQKEIPAPTSKPVETQKKFDLKIGIKPLVKEGTLEPTEYTIQEAKKSKEKEQASTLYSLDVEQIKGDILTNYTQTTGLKTPDELEALFHKGVERGLSNKGSSRSSRIKVFRRK